MSKYEKQIFKNRIVAGDGTVIQEGTYLAAEHLDHIEDGIVALEEAIEELGVTPGQGESVDINTQSVTFTQASSRNNITSGETVSTLFGKVAKWFSDLKNVAFTGSYNDLSDKPDIYTKEEVDAKFDSLVDGNEVAY